MEKNRKMDPREKKQRRIQEVMARLEEFSKQYLSAELAEYLFKLWEQIGRKRNYIIADKPQNIDQCLPNDSRSKVMNAKGLCNVGRRIFNDDCFLFFTAFTKFILLNIQSCGINYYRKN